MFGNIEDKITAHRPEADHSKLSIRHSSRLYVPDISFRHFVIVNFRHLIKCPPGAQHHLHISPPPDLERLNIKCISKYSDSIFETFTNIQQPFLPPMIVVQKYGDLITERPDNAFRIDRYERFALGIHDVRRMKITVQIVV